MMHDPFLHIEASETGRRGMTWADGSIDTMRCCCLAGRKTCSPEDCAMNAAGLSRHPPVAILGLILMALSASWVLAGLFWIVRRIAAAAIAVGWPV
jgi:hypothetical protein